MSLQHSLDAFRANFEAGGPPHRMPYWVHEPMHRATEGLIASGAASRTLKAGALASKFKLSAGIGAEVSSSALLAKGPLVVSFYRGIWSPYCNLELQALQVALPEDPEAGSRAGCDFPADPGEQSALGSGE